MTAVDTDAARPADLLAGHVIGAATGTKVTARRWGRHFTILDVDRTDSWPSDAAEVLAPLGWDLAMLAFYRRGRPVTISSWRSTSFLHAPNGAAPHLLGVLFRADAGDLDPARQAAAAVHPVTAEVEAEPSKTGRRGAAVEAVQAVEERVGRALGHTETVSDHQGVPT